MRTKLLIEPINPERQSSFWYNEECVVARFSKDDRYIKVEVVGEIIVNFPDEEGENGYLYLKNAQASNYACDKNYTDIDIDNFVKEELIEYSNWFLFICKKGKNGRWIEIEECVYSTIEEFKIAAIDLLNDNDFWEQLTQ